MYARANMNWSSGLRGVGSPSEPKSGQQPRGRTTSKSPSARVTSYSSGAQLFSPDKRRPEASSMRSAAMAPTPNADQRGRQPASSSVSPGVLPQGVDIDAAFRRRLDSIIAVREQIEGLARKHKTEEEAFVAELNAMMVRGTTEREQTRQELLQIVDDRNKAIAMLDKFRVEGNQIIQKLHGTVQELQQQHQRDAERIRELELQCEAEQKRRSDSDTAVSKGVAQRITQYQLLLGESEEVISSLRVTNEHLVAENVRLRQCLEDASASQQHRVERRSSDPDTPVSADMEQLREQLRIEKQQRLLAEEQAHELMMQQQRHVTLLEQRIRAATKQHMRTPRTPRSVSNLGVSRFAGGTDVNEVMVDDGDMDFVTSPSAVHINEARRSDGQRDKSLEKDLAYAPRGFVVSTPPAVVNRGGSVHMSEPHVNGGGASEKSVQSPQTQRTAAPQRSPTKPFPQRESSKQRLASEPRPIATTKQQAGSMVSPTNTSGAQAPGGAGALDLSELDMLEEQLKAVAASLQQSISDTGSA